LAAVALLPKFVSKFCVYVEVMTTSASGRSATLSQESVVR
jgi:hypothetical protein